LEQGHTGGLIEEAIERLDPIGGKDLCNMSAIPVSVN
jgi:hypothetical protein